MMTSNPTLTALTSAPANDQAPKQIVLLLHGLGANAEDLFSLVPYFREVMPDALFVSPNAPEPCDMAPVGYQWFSLQDRSEEALIRGVSKASTILKNYIDSLVEQYALGYESVYLIGFSQGGMVSLYTALRLPSAVAGVLSYSGALIAPSLLEKEIQSRPPCCSVHGKNDEVVPFKAFEEAIVALEKNKVPVHGYASDELGHGIDPAGLKIGIDFIKSV